MDKITITAIAFIVVAAFAGGWLAGTQVPGKAPGATTVPLPNITSCDIRCYGIAENNTAVIALMNSTFLVMLEENPTTGHQWNVSHTDGLTILADSYMPSNPGLPGAGGVHVWYVRAAGHGSQSFDAAYGRAWETSAVGNYHVNVQVLYPDENTAIPGSSS